jgi:hypothetical protein
MKISEQPVDFVMISQELLAAEHHAVNPPTPLAPRHENQ